MRRGLRILGGMLGVVVLALGAGIGAAWAPDRPVDALVARWAPPPSRFVPVLGLRVHVRDEGPSDDPLPVLLLHGTSASLHTWEGWASVLRADRRVVRLDLPGFGLTGPMPDGLGYDFDAYVRVVLGTLDALGVARVVVAGNSFGGNIAWELAAAAPDRVHALVLVDAAGWPRSATSVPIGFRLAMMPVVDRLLEVVLPRAVITSSLRNVYGDPSRVTPELIDRYYELTLRAGNRAALPRRIREAPTGVHADRIGRLALPTLILWGELDRLILPSDGDRFHDAIAGSELHRFAALGHVPHEEDPAATLVPVQVFLARVAPRPGS